MPISFDHGGILGQPRPYDAGRVQARAQEQALAAASLNTINASGSPQRVNAAPVAARAKNERDQSAEQRRGDEERTLTRESPTGRRPKFVAKGQSVNLLV